jgi:cadherin EGF LAG seven-pass G-type receptor 1
MFLPGTTLADGEWHRIEIKWLGSDISVGIDYGSKVTLLPMSANKIQGLYVGKILLGGPDSSSAGNSLLSEYGYVEGCVQVFIDNSF